jgi:hypothetical protein
LYNKEDKEKVGKESISKYKKAVAVEEENYASMYLQQQQTLCEATQPRLDLAEDALSQHQPRPSPLSSP